MVVSEIIKVLDFKLVHTDKTLYDLEEIYFYKNYKLSVEFNIEAESDDEKKFTLTCNTDNKDMTVLDVFSKKLDNQKLVFSNQTNIFASEIMYHEFLHDLRKVKINKLNN